MVKGICTLSNIPMRKEASGTAEMTNMLLFGDVYEVLESGSEWLYIRLLHDGYEGWLNAKQFESYSDNPLKQSVVTCFPLTSCTALHTTHYLLPGSRLPDYENNTFKVNNLEYHTAENATVLKSGHDIPSLSNLYLESPYLWGGRSPFGIDCSGFTQVVFAMAGISLKRDAWMQAEQGETITFREAAMAGDLAFFDNAEGKITHVGILLSPSIIIHASGKVRLDDIDNHGIMNREKKDYSHKLRIIKRIS